MDFLLLESNTTESPTKLLNPDGDASFYMLTIPTVVPKMLSLPTLALKLPSEFSFCCGL